MNLLEALKTNKKIRRSSKVHGYWQLHPAGTGPFSDMVNCSYFTYMEEDDNDEYYTTSIDLYPEDLLAEDWEVIDA